MGNIRAEKKNRLRKIWILGAGKFGKIAFERTVRNVPDAEITVVDANTDKAVVIGTQVITVCEDGIDWLTANLKRGDASPDIVIPAIPVHVAFEWIKRKVEDRFTIVPTAILAEIYKKFPNPVRNTASQVYVSHADFLCPDNCGEPPTICTFTKKEREESMFLLLANLKSQNLNQLVVRSHQLFPGVGGIFPADLWNVLDRIATSPEKRFLVSTACRCHGVVDGFQLIQST